jgi:hypothetical protein
MRRLGSTIVAAAAFLPLACGGSGGGGSGGTTPPPLSVISAGSLAGLPSAAGPTVASIAAMGADSWLNLGAPAEDPTWGRARGRSWSSRIAYAPELRAGFVYAEGVHGWYNALNRRYMDDIWAYDAMAHRWICVYPGAHVDTLSLALDAEGYEVDATDQRVPVAQNVHGYEMLGYDTTRRRFTFMPCTGGYWDAALDERYAWLPPGTSNWGYSVPESSPWWYDVETGRFDRRRVTGPYPPGGLGDVLIYIAAIDRTFYWHGASGSVWLYNAATNAWTETTPMGPPPPFGIDPVACLDTARNRVYIGGGAYPVSSGPHAFWCYDVAMNAWIDLSPTGQPPGGDNRYGTNVASMNYDSANDAVVLRYSDPGASASSRRIYAYAPSTNAWSSKAALPSGFGATDTVGSFYCAELNVHFFHVAGDSEDDGVVWAYRYAP